MKKMKTILLSMSMFSIVLGAGFIIAPEASALATGDLWGNQAIETSVEQATGLNKKDPREIIGGIIRVVLGFLGIIAVLIILAGGFKYMTAAGNDDKVEEAKKLMISGFIGLVIVLASFGLATFIMDALVNIV